MDGLVKSDIALNRKMLAELAVSEPFSFQQLVQEVKQVRPLTPSNHPPPHPTPHSNPTSHYTPL